MKKTLRSLYHFISPRFQTIHLDYPVKSKPRYGHGLPPHRKLLELIAAGDAGYADLLMKFSAHTERLSVIRDSGKAKADEPCWNNGFLPGLDIVALYGMLAENKPKHYIEIGSGNSTLVARKAISDLNLQTRIISIDPYPRESIDNISDKVIREPFEVIKNSFIPEMLGENDILFIDNSHRVFPNSDATVCFLELFPDLRPGVVVHVHDIYLPDDYPQFMCDRFYNEQYMLAAFVLANPKRYTTLFPAWYVSQTPALSALLDPLWTHPAMPEVEHHGGSYWLKISS